MKDNKELNRLNEKCKWIQISLGFKVRQYDNIDEVKSALKRYKDNYDMI